MTVMLNKFISISPSPPQDGTQDIRNSVISVPEENCDQDKTRSYLRNRLRIVLRPSVNPVPECQKTCMPNNAEFSWCWLVMCVCWGKIIWN